MSLLLQTQIGRSPLKPIYYPIREKSNGHLFLKERFRPIVMERKSVEYKSFMFLKSDGATLFSIHLMKSPLVIVRINDCAYEFEGYE